METELQSVSQTLQPAEKDADSQVWQRIDTFRDAKGNIVIRTNLAYAELETGMHYQEEGQWKDSRELIEPYPGGAIARHGGHKVIFAENFNNEVVVDLETRDNKRFQSRVLGLSYLDSASGKFVLIAEATNSIGQIVTTNQIIYTDAFSGVKADVRYTYTKAGLEQDVILIERPPTPESCGLDSKTTRLQVLTEFLSPPTPEIIVRPSEKAGENKDQTLDFGAMQMGPGKAFAIGLDEATTEKVSVVKQWTVIDGRTILFEEVLVSRIQKQLEALPVKKRTAFFWNKQKKPVQQTAALKLKLPARKTAKPAPRKMQMAKLNVPVRGVVLDYLLLSSTANFTFKGDTTYYVSGQVFLSGATTVEGGAVIKYAINGMVSLSAYSSSINWQATAYRPVVFTAKDDNSVGETISGSTGNPLANVYYANPAFDIQNVYNPGAIKNVRFCYAQQAITVGSSSPLDLSHAQFVKCRYGVGAGNYQSLTLNLKNALFSNVQTPFNLQTLYYMASISAQQVTFDSASTLVFEGATTYYSLNLVNCILANVTGTGWAGNPGDHLTGNNNGFFNTSFTFGTGIVPSCGNPFQTVKAGNYYLADGSCFRGQGSTSIDATLANDLTKKTTYPPPPANVLDNVIINSSSPKIFSPQVPRDTCTPDLGYHYDPLDYLCSRVTIGNGSAPIIVNPGAAVGLFGTVGFLPQGGGFISQGSAQAMNRLVWYPAVQEQPVRFNNISTVGSAVFNPTLGGGNAGPYQPKIITLSFTDLPMQGFRQSLIGQCYAYHYPVITLSDCWLRGVNLTVGMPSYGPDANPAASVTLNNNLLERGTLGLFNGYVNYYGTYSQMPLNVTLYNNLFWSNTVSLTFMDSYAATHLGWVIKDNLFDGAVNTFSGDGGYASLIANSYDAFRNTSNPLGGASHVTLISLAYAAGPLGKWYIGQASPALVNAGSRTAVAAALDQHTQRTDQTPDAGTVDIGFHYSTIPQPTANPLSGLQVCRGHSISFVLSGSSPNTGSCILFYTVLTQPQHGTLSGMPPNLTYTETDLNFCGNDTFTYKVNDGYLDSLPATVTITVGDPNPVANCQDVMTGINTPVTFTLSGSVTCGETLTFNVVNGPANGTLGTITPVDATHATVTYTPGSSTFTGTDGFDFTVSDYGFTSPSAHVTVNVVPGPVLATACRQDRILLYWSIPQLGNGFFKDFRIYRCDTTTGTCTPTVLYDSVTDPSMRMYADTGVQANKTYCYRVTFRHQNRCDASIVYESPFSNADCKQLCSPPVLLISGNNAASGSGPIQTFDFATGNLLNSFVPDGATVGSANGRGIAVHGSEIFYTELTGSSGASDGIHVAPYGTQGSGGADIRVIPNPQPTAGIQDLAFRNNTLYALTGYPNQQLQVFKLNPTTGAVIGGPIFIGSPASDDSDGFTVMPNGNFLINDGDTNPTYREYDGTAGSLVSGGSVVDLTAFGFSRGTGVATAADDQSLYFMADITGPQTLVQTDLAGHLMGFQPVNSTLIEDIDVVIP